MMKFLIATILLLSLVFTLAQAQVESQDALGPDIAMNDEDPNLKELWSVRTVC